MSRFLPDTLFVGVEKERLSFVRRSRGFKPRFVMTFELPLPIDFWENPDLDWVSNTLPKEVFSGTRAWLTVADQLIRYFLVERPQGARNAAEIRLAAALRFEELYAEVPHSWQIEMDLPPWSTNYLACGLPTNYLIVLKQLFSELRVPLHRITPYGIESWNRHAGIRGMSESCFLALSHNTVWLTLRRDRRWLTAVAYGLPNGKCAELPNLIHRECTRHGFLENWRSWKIYITGATDDQPSAIFPNAHLLTAAIWPGFDQHHASSFQLALSPIWPTCV